MIYILVKLSSLEKYSFAASMTFGERIMEEIIVGIAMRANIPSIKLITKSIVTIEPTIKLKV